MEFCKHCNLRDAGKRRLDYVDAHVEGREPKDLREPETHERANHESPEEDEREVLVEADVADPDRVDHDPVEDQRERRRDAAEVLRGRENGARNEHVREDKGDGGEKADERRERRRASPFPWRAASGTWACVASTPSMASRKFPIVQK